MLEDPLDGTNAGLLGWNK